MNINCERGPTYLKEYQQTVQFMLKVYHRVKNEKESNQEFEEL